MGKNINSNLLTLHTGFGFVTFADPTHLNAVLQNGPHCLDGRTIDPKPCNPRTLQKPRKGGGFKIFLGGLPSNITETDLRHFFNRYGKVTEVVIMYDQEKKKSRGFGFLSFEDEGSVDCKLKIIKNINSPLVPCNHLCNDSVLCKHEGHSFVYVTVDSGYYLTVGIR